MISVLVPVYNVEPYLAEMIESVLAQTCGDFEMLILDDGSRDNSLPLARRYAERDGRIRVWSRPNRGISATRNDLLREARGDLVAWMDSDDVALPEWLECLRKAMLEHADWVVAGCRVNMMDAEGLPICAWKQPLTHEAMDAAHMNCGTKTIMFGSSMMRREALLRIGGFREDLVGAEDLDVLLKLAEIGRIECVPDVLYRYRQHLGSTCRARSADVRSDVQRVLKAACERRGVPYHEVDERTEAPSHADAHRKWAWWALREGHVSTARKHALRAMRCSPLSPECWRLLYCTCRGH